MMKKMRNLWIQVVSSYKSLFSLLSFENYLWIKIVVPILQMIFFVLLVKFSNGEADITRWVITNSLMLISISAFYGLSTSFAMDRSMGTLKLVVVSPTNKYWIFLGRSIMYIIDGFISCVFAVIMGFLIFGLHLNMDILLKTMIIVLINTFSVMSLGMLIGILSILTRDIQMITNAAFSILLVLAGVEIPIDRLPTFLSKISYILPMSRSTRAVDVLLSGSSNYNTLLIGELIVGLFYMIVALGVYSYVERASRKNATLDFY